MGSSTATADVGTIGTVLKLKRPLRRPRDGWGDDDDGPQPLDVVHVTLVQEGQGVFVSREKFGPEQLPLRLVMPPQTKLRNEKGALVAVQVTGQEYGFYSARPA